RPPPSVLRLPSSVSRPPSSVLRLPSLRLPSSVFRLPSSVFRPPSAVLMHAYLLRWLRWLIPVLVLVSAFGVVAWYKLLRGVPPPGFAGEAERFKYGSIGAENTRGLPDWIWVVLPRVFPDYLPGPGGYASFGLVWEPGQELPVGFSKQTIGFPRVANNCAICH